MLDILLLLVILLIWFIENKLENLCLKTKGVLWSKLIYIFMIIISSTFLFILIDNNWFLIRFNLEPSIISVIIAFAGIFYLVMKAGDFLYQLNKEPDKLK